MTATHQGTGRRRQDGAIAILGAACRLPGAPDLDAFWTLLAEGRDAVTSVPADRFTSGAFLHPRRGEPGKSYTFAAGVLEDVAGFDAAAFGISPREAAEMDPQQRLLLELSIEALEDAGIPASRLAGSDTGVFIGGSLTDYADLRVSDPAGGDRYFMTGSALSILANRLSNILDLHGPTQTFDTACSSALVALHWACEALRSGRVPTALVGGANMLLTPFPFLGFARAGMLSPAGRCHAFDARADGYVRAEGGGMVVLKRLEDALADGDAIRAVILAAGVNAAGHTLGLSLPSQPAQARLIEAVMAEAGIDPDRIGYFEAHGTGTAAGDPLEAGAIGAAIGRRRATSLPIGSAKTNIGHTEPAAGIVGLLKAMLIVERGQIPPSLHFQTPNPNIDFANLGLRVPVAAEPLPRRARAVVGVNSFGFGGTNACALVGAAPASRRRPAGPEGMLPPLLLSARSAAGLRALADRWQALLATTPAPALPGLLRGAASHRDLLPHRLALRGADPAALASGLATWRAGEAGAAAAGIAGPQAGIAFVFSGNGAPWPGMAQAALAASPVFRNAVAEADAALAPHLGWSVAEQLEAGVSGEAVAATDRAQPLLFAVQHGIVAALAAEGIRPAFCLGHSVGEIAAAAAAGLLPLAEAARLVVVRSRHQNMTRGQGRMAALGASPDAALPVLGECGPGLEIAAVNAPASITIAGPVDALHRLSQAAAARRWSYIALDLDYAFHSAAMDPLQEGLLRDLAGLTPAQPSRPMISTVTGEALAAAACTPEHWWRNLREPVRFLGAMETTARLGAGIYLEIGPNPILQSYLRESLRHCGSESGILASLSRRDPAGDPFPGIADRAFALGADPRGGPRFAGPATRRGLPLTPFDRQRHWISLSPEATPIVQPRAEHRLLGFRRMTEPGLWTRHLDTLVEPWLADHRLASQPVLPAAAMAEMALAAALAWYPEAAALELRDLVILQAMPLEAERSREIRSTLDAAGAFVLTSRRRLSDDPWTLHAEARVAALPRLPDAGAEEPAPAQRLDRTALLALASGLGLDYGPAFQSLEEVAVDAAAGFARARLVRPAAAPPDTGFLLHPVRLDGALQGLLGLLAGASVEAGTGLVPVRIGRLVLRRGAEAPAAAAIRLTERGSRSATADLVLRDAMGGVVAVLEGCAFLRIRLPGQESLLSGAFRVALLPAPGAETPESPELAGPVAVALRQDAALDLGEAALLLEGFCASAAHAALSASEATGPYARMLLATLAEDGLATSRAGTLQPLEAPDLPAAGEIWRQVLLEQPVLAQDLAWAAQAAEQLPLALAHRLAGEAGAPPPSNSAGYDRLARVLAEAVGAFAAAWPAGRPLRVLEVAAGAGPLTAHLLRVLAASGRRVLLTAAPLPEQSAMPLPPGAEGIEFAIQAWDPQGAEPPPLAADLVVGLAAGARLRLGANLAGPLRQAAAPGGTLLLAEPMSGWLWNFCCGQEPGWCGAAPLANAAEWSAALAAEGWTAPLTEPLRAAPWPALLIGGRAAAGATLLAAPKLRRVALFADAAAAPLRGAVAAALQSRGATVTGGSLAEAAALPPHALADSLVVALAGGGQTPEEIATSLAALARLAAAAEGSAAGFRIVTQGGQQPDGPGTRHDPSAAALFALGRVLANEHPALKPRRIDLTPGLAPEQAARRLAVELLTEVDDEAEVTLTEAARLVPRLRPGLPPAPPAGGPQRLEIRQPGQLGSLNWTSATLPPPGPGEVVVRIEAAGLNFRDVMWAQGLLPEEALLPGFAGPSLGMECAGRVEGVGEGAPFMIGQRVFGVAPAALATHARTRAEALVAMPEGLDAVEAATIPVAFMTAVHALEELAGLEPGERVLIHGGTGAVGLAALQVALACGARVAASAGSPARRAFLRAAGAELVLDSRDAGFADALRARWPEGVDVVLNSLAGTAMERSLGLLRPFGRFIELGKRDFAEGSRVALRPLRRNATYFAVDVDELARARPVRAARLLAGIAERLAQGGIRPLPATTYPAASVEAAFRALQAGGHIGKLVIHPPSLSVEAPGASPLARAADGTILVIGGTGGFGLATALWLAGQGARHLALVSRRGGQAPGAEAALRDLAARGAIATLHACDATDAEALGRLLAELRASAPPIRGVVHAAAIAGDGAAALLDPGRAARVLAAKLSIADALDRLTAQDPIELFLMYSSATVPIGNPGQAAYVAANAAIEALARRRRAQGRPANAIGWGPIADAGMLADDAATVKILERRLGTSAMRAEEALGTLPALLATNAAALGLARIAWSAARSALAILNEPAFETVRSLAAPAPDAADLRARLREANEAEALVLLRETMAAELARILRLPAQSVSAEAPLAGLGLDSLGGMELRTALEQRVGVAIGLDGIGDGLTLDGLARRVLAQLQAGPRDEATAALLAAHEPDIAAGLENAA
ncbi:type I polyketide synthase [Belnapia rosea]|uniref:Acyl transferase domain-containing protein n=1 Tax=Belnapia rosea TaxID=938405 RepID=A0A1G6JZM8_9PROT|nr:type I polyketide synthase [Belnapia rosea]SDC24041.1 Acyl transferase domain-containing protein [Belnapia rosea]